MFVPALVIWMLGIIAFCTVLGLLSGEWEPTAMGLSLGTCIALIFWLGWWARGI